MNDSQLPATDTPATGDEPLDRLDELLSLFFDDGLDEEQIAELNQTLLTDPSARTRCFDAAQLHADLQAFFRDDREHSDSKVAPPLPGLPAGLMTGGTPSV